MLSSFANSFPNHFVWDVFKFGEFLPCPPDGMESVCPTFVRCRRRRRRHTWIRCWAPPPPRAQPLIKNSNQEQSVHGKLRYLGGVEEDEEKWNKKGRWRQTTPKSGEICSPVISKSIESATRQFKAHISTNQWQLGEWANCWIPTHPRLAKLNENGFCLSLANSIPVFLIVILRFTYIQKVSSFSCSLRALLSRLFARM